MPVLRRLTVALVASLIAAGVAIPALAQPTTCVEANDAFEYGAGRYQNVGIYQRVHGPDAEAACQRDHWDQRAFRWRPAAPPAPPPAPAPAPAPAARPQDHPDYVRVRQVADARGAAPAKAAAVAASVVVRDQVDAFLRGTDGGVEYGYHACEWQSTACPLAPVYVPPPPSLPPRIDPGLQPAWDALRRSVVWMMFDGVENAQTVRVSWGSFPEQDDGHYTFGWYYRSTHSIVMSEAFRGERPEALAAALAHELWHAVSYIPYPRDFSACIVDEVLAFVLQGHTWRSFDLRPVTTLERGHAKVLRRALIDRGDFDDDVSDWPTLRTYVLNDLNYRQTCAA